MLKSKVAVDEAFLTSRISRSSDIQRLAKQLLQRIVTRKRGRAADASESVQAAAEAVERARARLSAFLHVKRPDFAVEVSKHCRGEERHVLKDTLHAQALSDQGPVMHDVAEADRPPTPKKRLLDANHLPKGEHSVCDTKNEPKVSSTRREDRASEPEQDPSFDETWAMPLSDTSDLNRNRAFGSSPVKHDALERPIHNGASSVESSGGVLSPVTHLSEEAGCSGIERTFEIPSLLPTEKFVSELKGDHGCLETLGLSCCY